MTYTDQGLENAYRSQQPTHEAVMPWPEHGYAGPFPAYTPGYGPYAFNGGSAARRPGSVIAAAVLAFIVGGLGGLVYLLALAVVGIAAAGSKNESPLLAVVVGVLLVGLALSLLWVWGGVAALRGRGRNILVVLSSIHVALSLLGLAVDVATRQGSGILSTVLNLLFMGTILILILQPSSTEFFRARRG